MFRIKRYLNYISKVLNTLYYITVYGSTGIVMNAWVFLRFGKIRHRNFGDELNYYILKSLTRMPVSNYTDICSWGRKGKPDLLFIGSLVEDFTTPDTVIWGSGALYGGNRPLRNKPRKVYAVRGQLTRKYLLDNNVDCPEVYGDPALLCPLLYIPSLEKKYKIGMIPHVDELNHNVVKSLEEKGIHIIKLVGYDDWHYVIDEICQCEIILSSSLHGLIIADAYGVPNVWVTISGKLLGGTFKFFDYFSGVGRTTSSPFELTEDVSMAELQIKCKDYSPITFDADKFIKAAPIKISL